MKKFGFTLAELLVTLGIIAVIAAITAPMLDGIIPDKNKAKVLKAYKTLSSINADLLGDPSIYMMDEDGNCSGIDCKTLPGNPKYNNAAQYSGDAKYCYLLADKLNRSNNITATGNTLTFDTTDGLHWTLACSAGANPTVSIKTDDNADCRYGTCNNSKYNSFVFDVKNSGRLSGGDPLTQAYLMNPSKLNDKKADLAKAKTLKKEDSENKDNNNDQTKKDWNERLDKFGENGDGRIDPDFKDFGDKVDLGDKIKDAYKD